MMAAGRAAERGNRVLLLERGPALGRKLLMTGNGRCNVTNSAPLEDSLRAFGRKGGFLRKAFTLFGNRQFRDWLDGRGVRTVEEEEGRVFPATHDARSILETLTAYLMEGGVEVRLHQRVRSLWIREGRIAGVRVSGAAFEGANVLIATGGLSYPPTGSTGDGYDLARRAGHTITPTYPAIVGLETKDEWPKGLQGVPIRDVRVRARGKRSNKLVEARGDAIWTHYGVSGPAILDISTAVVPALRKGSEVRLELDLLPSDSEDSIQKHFAHAAETEGNRTIRELLSDWVPRRTAQTLLGLRGIEPSKRLSQCSKADRGAVVDLLKRLVVHVSQARPVEEAIVTGGGVSIDEVEGQRMESCMVGGLYLAGEVLDLHGPCGGYNIQAAVATGYLAGQSV